MSRFEAPAPLPWPLPLRGRALLRCLAGFALVTSVAANPAAVAEELDGGDLAWKYHCVTCHGANGVANSDRYPNIAGQNEPYLVSRLRYFRSKSEPGNQMNAQAAPLSDQEIEALAAYFAGASS